MITRTIGKVLRGKATPLQIALACILGSMIGFVPGLTQGPGLMLALVLGLVILNANLGIAAITAGLAKGVSLAVMPLSFGVGRMLLDGPAQPIFKWAINTPVLALFGFEYYATTGGMVLGFIFGAILAVALIKGVQRFRKKMTSLEESSPLYAKLSEARWAKALTFIFIGGGHGKKTYEQLLSTKLGNPIRPIGVVFALLTITLLVIVGKLTAEPIVTAQLLKALERANGATVDLGSAHLDLKQGKLSLTDLALADPNNLDTDIFRAAKLEADVSAASLLTKRLALDSLVFSDASSGQTRATAGRLIGPAVRPSPKPTTTGDEKTIDDYIAQGQLWKKRLAQARRWIEKIGSEQPPADATAQTRKESLRERLARQVRQRGYARVAATHLIDGAPTFLIRRLSAQGVRTAQLEGEVLDIEGQNISTQPHLVEGPTALTITSRSGTLKASTRLDAGASTLILHYAGLPADTIGRQLTVMGEPPIKGGTIDIDIDGSWSPLGVGMLDLPMQITLHDTTLSLPSGGGSTHVDTLTLPIGLRGPIDNPAIRVDADALADALVKAGADKLVQRGETEATKAIKGALGGKGDDIADEAGKALKGLLGGGKKKNK